MTTPLSPPLRLLCWYVSFFFCLNQAAGCSTYKLMPFHFSSHFTAGRLQNCEQTINEPTAFDFPLLLALYVLTDLVHFLCLNKLKLGLRCIYVMVLPICQFGAYLIFHFFKIIFFSIGCGHAVLQI